ncbi:Maf family protein [Lederbergia sp. NSJ-179]|uniref:Maf family protein n=1 Tax=Lederbergia sp. NSJ-179 TaxID=2931402 RepID=UPI001FD15DFC|nr:Maf family protein [Lederbergia sp. NSJ-179]MCJ7839898.1 Maf family protein [Lederbergia sp. NSJ-179]
MKDLILASTSPRRKELLQKLNIPFTTFSPNVDESICQKLSPEDTVLTLSSRKANVAAQQFPAATIIAADTIVVSEHKILGKPKSRQEAKQMLCKLSGKRHFVFTGVTVIDEKKVESFYEKTAVDFWPLTNEEINKYLDSGEPFDKAGAYGIQGSGALFVKSIHGDYFSVVGLPISRLFRLLVEKRLVPPPETSI